MRLLIINDHGIDCGGTETRIRIFVEALLQMPFCEQVHILQYENNQPFQHPKLFYHSATFSPYCATKHVIHKYAINLIQVHNLFKLQPYLLFATHHLPVVWWAHDYWLLCTKRSFIDPYHAETEILCPKATYNVCTRCMTWKNKIKYMLWKYIMNSANFAIAPSYILKEIHEYHDILRGKWHVITPWISPIYLFNQKKIRKKENTLLFVGSLIPFKGAWVAAKALKHIVKSFPETTLVFVGSEQEPDNPFRKNIDRICKEDGTIGHVIYVGKKNKEEITLLHREATAFICPTVCMESFGLTWAEAMASGCPVIASSIGSIPEYIIHRKTGLLFPARDHLALAKQVIALFSDKKLQKTIAISGKKYAQTTFSVDRAMQELCALYITILSKK